MAVKQPYLIQRASIRKPLADPATSTLTKSVKFSYMGSAEFEFGALPRSLRRFKNGTIHTGILKSVNHEDSPLRFLTALSEEDMAVYQTYLTEMWFGKGYRLKELSYFGVKDMGESWESTDFWWDIDNDVMWSFDKNYMNRLPSFLQNSFKVMA